MAEFVFFALLLLVLLLVAVVLFLFLRLNSLREQLQELLFAKASQSVKYGKLTEQFLPFAQKFPFDANSFRFIGTPVDGIVFGDDKIVFCEFKAASSQLSQKQKKIRQLVEEKKVEWFELRVN